ncbi:hypothetical protein ACD591_04240 [Rufibacter glacialis]|uniref:Uncharacterized protein n=1 Tax=Rufibacter glacialis TaxID=1259555 RepID=A0A5M8QH72_9BACT|nr:hypothetical protein [Rufibacter glacialis]KAA6434568.1 hypothetical protein FOE74_10305 [Rufibacter glacialis]
MSTEKNKNLENNQNTESNQPEAGRVPEAIGKLPLPTDVNDDPSYIEDSPGVVPSASGRRGNISVEDGGNVEGSSTGSR